MDGDEAGGRRGARVGQKRQTGGGQSGEGQDDEDMLQALGPVHPLEDLAVGDERVRGRLRPAHRRLRFARARSAKT